MHVPAFHRLLGRVSQTPHCLYNVNACIHLGYCLYYGFKLRGIVLQHIGGKKGSACLVSCRLPDDRASLVTTIPVTSRKLSRKKALSRISTKIEVFNAASRCLCLLRSPCATVVLERLLQDLQGPHRLSIYRGSCPISIRPTFDSIIGSATFLAKLNVTQD